MSTLTYLKLAFSLFYHSLKTPSSTFIDLKLSINIVVVYVFYEANSGQKQRRLEDVLALVCVCVCVLSKSCAYIICHWNEL